MYCTRSRCTWSAPASYHMIQYHLELAETGWLPIILWYFYFWYSYTFSGCYHCIFTFKKSITKSFEYSFPPLQIHTVWYWCLLYRTEAQKYRPALFVESLSFESVTTVDSTSSIVTFVWWVSVSNHFCYLSQLHNTKRNFLTHAEPDHLLMNPFSLKTSEALDIVGGEISPSQVLLFYD